MNECRFKEDQRCWGLLLSLNLYQCNQETLSSIDAMKEYLLALCDKIKMEPHGLPLVDRFGKKDLEGVTGVLLIKTSSITAHADEIENRLFIDIFSCKNFNHEEAIQFSVRFFDAKDNTWNLQKRQ